MWFPAIVWKIVSQAFFKKLWYECDNSCTGKSGKSNCQPLGVLHSWEDLTAMGYRNLWKYSKPQCTWAFFCRKGVKGFLYASCTASLRSLVQLYHVLEQERCDGWSWIFTMVHEYHVIYLSNVWTIWNMQEIDDNVVLIYCKHFGLCRAQETSNWVLIPTLQWNAWSIWSMQKISCFRHMIFFPGKNSLTQMYLMQTYWKASSDCFSMWIILKWTLFSSVEQKKLEVDEPQEIPHSAILVFHRWVM